MLFHDEFTGRSLSDFLHLDCLLNIDKKNIKKFNYFLIKDTKRNREEAFSHIPENLFTEFTYKKEKYLRITKADLLCYQKEKIANPIRAWGEGDEYSTRLITSLLFQATPKWTEYCTNLYEHGKDHYIHDQRAGSGKAKQFLNWMYSDEGYPGRLEEQNEYENLIPLCFPNPELLRRPNFTFFDGQYALTVSENWEESMLHKKLNELKLLDKFITEEPDDQKGIKRTILAPFCIWQKAITEILKEQELEKQLSEEQQKTHLVSLIVEFVKNKKEIRDVVKLQNEVTSFIQSINKNKTENVDQQENQLPSFGDQLIREPIVVFKDNDIGTQLNEKLKSYPNNLKRGVAVKTGDCFFDSIAQGLNELREKGIIPHNDQFTVKSLREDCANYANENKGSSVYKKIINDAGTGGYFVERKNLDGNAVIEEKETFNKYLQNVKNTSEKNGPLPIWGRLNIEGKMICEKYNVKIQVIDVLEDIEDNKYLIEESGYIIESEEGESENVVYMLNYKQHFVPLLSNIDKDIEENQEIFKDEIYGREVIQDTSFLTNETDKLAIQNAIKALYQIRRNIAANKEFFDKFTDDKGVLQAEQYFRTLTAHIDSEITFLEVFKNNLTEEDLEIFLNQTCKKVHSDINELLLAHDFLMTDNLEHRDMVINLAQWEVKELYQYTRDRVDHYNNLVEFHEGQKTRGKDETINRYYINAIKTIPASDTEYLVSVIKKGENSEDFKNKWLFNQLKSHPLFEFFNVKNTDEVRADVGKLWKMVENDDPNKEWNKSSFIHGLTKIVNSSSDDKNKIHIEQSRWLAFKQWLYNISYYIPLSSIWLSHVNPNNSRTKTKYKGSTLKEKLYTKNKVIPVSEFSQNIREALKLSIDDKEFVESKHEANWLIKTFRKKHEISGAREKILTYLGKNKVLWYTLLTLFILFTSAAAIAGRVLSCLGIVPPVVVDKMINSLRGIFDGFVIMFGLDTIIDSIFILAVDLAGLIVRFVDYILLFGLVSKTIRYLTKGVGKLAQGISNGFKLMYETIRVYGLKGSLILLHDKITNNKQPKKEEKCEIEEKAKKKKDIMISGEHDVNDISQAIQKLWQESRGKENDPKSNSERIKYVFNNLKSLMERDLVCRDAKFPTLLENFSNIHDLFKSTTDWNFIRLQYEFHYLLNKYPEKFSVEMPTNNGQKQYAKKDITVENERMKIYDVMAAVSLRTKLAPEEKGHITSIGAKKVITRVNNANNGEKVSLEVLDKKIAAIKWAINAIESSDIDFSIKKSEPIFQTTKAHMSAEIALHDYSKKLEEFRNRKEPVSVDELNSYEIIFTQYIANMHHILSKIDEFTTCNHESNSLHQFREAFSNNSVLLKSPSHEAENAALIFGIDCGGVSIASRVKEYTVDFVKEFQDPKVFAAAFAAYYIAIQIPGLLNIAHAITDTPEIILNGVGLGIVHDNLTETELAKIFFEVIYEKGELLKDVWMLFGEFKDGIIGKTEFKKRWSEVKQTVKRTKIHSNHDHHGGDNAKERLISFVNGLVHLIFTILGINLIKSLFRKAKAEYHTFFHYYNQERQNNKKVVEDDSKSTMMSGVVISENIVNKNMYNLSEVQELLENPMLIENVIQDCSRCA